MHSVNGKATRTETISTQRKSCHCFPETPESCDSQPRPFDNSGFLVLLLCSFTLFSACQWQLKGKQWSVWCKEMKPNVLSQSLNVKADERIGSERKFVFLYNYPREPPLSTLSCSIPSPQARIYPFHSLSHVFSVFQSLPARTTPSTPCTTPTNLPAPLLTTLLFFLSWVKRNKGYKGI